MMDEEALHYWNTVQRARRLKRSAPFCDTRTIAHLIEELDAIVINTEWETLKRTAGDALNDFRAH